MPSQRTNLANDKPGLSPSNRSLERGIELLRAFRPGSELLGNGELVERTGLSKATVSRLAQTLVGAGLLQLEPARRAYRLAPAVLSLAHSMRSGSRVLSVAGPLMRTLAESRRINVGLAAPDRDEMIYLESIRYARRVALRHVVSGQRVPMELTSLGHAYLSVAPKPKCDALMKIFRDRRGQAWGDMERAIKEAFSDLRRHGFCSASWQPEVVAIAAPLIVDGAIYIFNLSLSTDEPQKEIALQFGPCLLDLIAEVRYELDKESPLFGSP